MDRKNETISTYEREMKDAVFKEAFEKQYVEFVFQELLISLVKDDKKSVSALIKEMRKFIS
jgi:hypothetical protein